MEKITDIRDLVTGSFYWKRCAGRWKVVEVREPQSAGEPRRLCILGDAPEHILITEDLNYVFTYDDLWGPIDMPDETRKARVVIDLDISMNASSRREIEERLLGWVSRSMTDGLPLDGISAHIEESHATVSHHSSALRQVIQQSSLDSSSACCPDVPEGLL